MTPNSARLQPDTPPRNIFARFAPDAWLPFVQLARLDRPVGWQLLLAPCWWSSALASASLHRSPNLLHLALLLIGAMAMRGAGSTYNDILDRDIDARVERTRLRPLPSGRVGVRAAVIFMVAQSLAGFCVLIAFNGFTIWLGMASLAIVAVYPLMKRITSWPQLVLGFAFAWGGLVGWAAETGGLSLAPVMVYVAAILWTIGYDTIYALQDTRDDALIGVGSTARLFGAQVKVAVGVFYALALACLALALWLASTGLWAWLGWLGFAAHLAWQVSAIVPANAAEALKLFRSNRDAGLLLFAGWAAQALAG